jgi:dipeptidase E
VVLCGLSAGSLCWFSEAVTAFHGPPEPVRGLGLLPHSNCVHYDGEAVRGEVFREMIATGQMREGYAAEDGAALHFEGRELLRVVSSRPKARAYRVSSDGEHPLAVSYLGERAALAVA